MPKKKSVIEVSPTPLPEEASERTSLQTQARPLRLLFTRSDGELVEQSSDRSLVEQRIADWTQETLVNLPKRDAPQDESGATYFALEGWSRFDNDKIPPGLLGPVETLVQKIVSNIVEHGQESPSTSLGNDFGELTISAFLGISPAEIEAKIRLHGTINGLDTLSVTLDCLHEPVIRKFQTFLDGLVGKSFGSVAANRAVADEVQQLLNRLGLRVRCTREGCGEPARIFWRDIPRMKEGCLQFEHKVAGRPTSHGGSATWPKLELVAAPPDSRRKTMRTADETTSK